MHYSIAFGRHIGFSIETPTRLYYNEVFNRNLNFVFRIHVLLGNIPFSPTFSGKSSPNGDLHGTFGAEYFFPRESPIQSINGKTSFGKCSIQSDRTEVSVGKSSFGCRIALHLGATDVFQ